MHAAQNEITAVAELDHWWFVARRRILREVFAEALPPSSERFVIDVGCCTGGNLVTLAENYSCLGVDRSSSAIALARRRFPAADFLCGRAPDDLEGVTARADAFLLADILEHVERDGDMLAALVCGARPGAYFLITVPADMSLWSRHDESHGHFRRYDLDSFSRLWQGLPVSVCLLSYFNSRLYWPIRTVRMINRWRGCAYGESDTDLKMPSRAVNWILQRIFAGERRRLLRLLRGQTKRRYGRGVSLIALLRSEAGSVDESRLEGTRSGQCATKREIVSCANASS